LLLHPLTDASLVKEMRFAGKYHNLQVFLVHSRIYKIIHADATRQIYLTGTKINFASLKLTLNSCITLFYLLWNIMTVILFSQLLYFLKSYLTKVFAKLFSINRWSGSILAPTSQKQRTTHYDEK